MSDQPEREQISEQFDAVQMMVNGGDEESYEAGVHDALGWVLGYFDAPIELVDADEDDDGDEDDDDEEDDDGEDSEDDGGS